MTEELVMTGKYLDDPWFWRGFYETAELAGLKYQTGEKSCEDCAEIAMEIAEEMCDLYYETDENGEEIHYWDDAQLLMAEELKKRFKEREENVEMEKYEVPKADWDDAFEKLREIADKADQLAGDIEETKEYHDKWDEDHDLAIVTVRELTTIMQKAAQMADEIALTMERKELEKKRVG